MKKSTLKWAAQHWTKSDEAVVASEPKTQHRNQMYMYWFDFEVILGGFQLSGSRDSILTPQKLF